ncbi:MAG: DUF1349 domain-containing protein [Hyphomicrobiaceae bacterium]
MPIRPSFARVLLVFAAILALAVVVVTVTSFSDRDSMVYRAASKALFPISQQFEVAGEPTAHAPLRAKLNQHPDGWEWFQSELVSKTHEAGGLVMVPSEESVWWKNKRGPLLYTHRSGDFETSVTVTTRKKSAPKSYPDQAFQFGGLMIRDPRGAAWFSQEEYLFIAVGYRGAGLQIESKSTFNGYSKVIGTDWESGDARLRIRRKDNRFELYAFSDKQSEWKIMQVFERDLPDVVQVGLFSYAYSRGKGIVDLIARFSDFEIHNISEQANSN